ncbi:uncharacterized protein CANTADRAFT_308000 [Suhomyces tanzawaensis NRRL Y-17324]|uniref:Uncharacterized protein n=1 Tax=Suhomyces tanzawaensis NRRL Y-17324 TaxID=984487 RepID=A0A1E4SD11_9ASCO|nr:uncharacterized protein CANTADRAFT_308000 [Suhomyces tanzawaensis NRRL Y-17324]ODV77399.1 hypothetical protein CANTADRAFT_308000 [Suhomyces tanzawaensis NRRL Y-17324]
MSAQEPQDSQVEVKTYPDSTNKWPTPFVNLANASAYPSWTPIDTKKETTQIFKFGFYTTVGAYAWLYLWKRTTFKLGLPLTAVGFATIATATKGIVTNLREKNDGWNTFIAVGTGNLACLTVGFKNMPVKHKVLTGIAGATVTALVDHALWAQSPSSAGRNARYAEGNTEEVLDKQQFWDVWKRRPLSQTVESLGAGRGIFKP